MNEQIPTNQVLDWILTEIGAGMSLKSSPEAELWNSAHERCKSIIRSYRDGCGLFQMTAKRKAEVSNAKR